jgi:Nif11 domain
MSIDQLQKFYKFTFDDADIQNRLIGAQSIEEFVLLAVDIGRENGYEFSQADMMNTMDGLGISGSFDEVENLWQRKILQIGWAPLGYSR